MATKSKQASSIVDKWLLVKMEFCAHVLSHSDGHKSENSIQLTAGTNEYY